MNSLLNLYWFEFAGKVYLAWAVRYRVLDPAQYGKIDVTTRCTKGGRKLDVRRRMPGAGLSR